MNKTGIEYLDFTWNPIAMRCTRISPACDHCWHLSRADMFAKNPKFSEYDRGIYAGMNPPALCINRLEEPLKRKKPAVIGVMFMGDMFHEKVEIKWIRNIIDIITRADHHFFIICTKRVFRAYACGLKWPDNAAFMFTAEDQRAFDDRVKWAMMVGAKYIGVSVEPMLGPIDMRGMRSCRSCGHFPAINGVECEQCNFDPAPDGDRSRKIDFVTCGGETGSMARVMLPQWPRKLRDDCKAAGADFFFKHWGEFVPNFLNDPDTGEKIQASDWMDRVGRKSAGRIIDGRTWDELPWIKK